MTTKLRAHVKSSGSVKYRKDTVSIKVIDWLQLSTVKNDRKTLFNCTNCFSAKKSPERIDGDVKHRAPLERIPTHCVVFGISELILEYRRFTPRIIAS